MDPQHVAVRAIATYLFLLILLRAAGKGAIRHASTFDFVLALVIGDLVDDAVWAEVPFIQFGVAATTLLLTKLGFSIRKRRTSTHS